MNRHNFPITFCITALLTASPWCVPAQTATAPAGSAAADSTQAVIYSPGQLKTMGATLASKATASGIATMTLGEPTVMLTYRNRSGGAEVHEHFTDVFTIVDGTATLETGGSVVSAKVNDQGETRGSALENATRQVLHAGDIVRIPAGVPHRMTLASGETILYFVAKVKR